MVRHIDLKRLAAAVLFLIALPMLGGSCSDADNRSRGASLSDAGGADASEQIALRQRALSAASENQLVLDAHAWEDRFGTVVDISSTGYAVVGTPDDDEKGVEAGAVYVYESTAANGWTLHTKLFSPTPTQGERFGEQVAISGTTVVVGNPNSDLNEANAGVVDVFELSSGTYSNIARLQHPSLSSYDRMGSAVDISGDTILSQSKDSSGDQVHVFSDSTGTWTHQGQLSVSDPDAEYLGDTLTIEGDSALVSEPSADFGFGRVYVFSRSASTSQWTEDDYLVSPSLDTRESFGDALDIEQDLAVVGAPDGDNPGTNAGAVYVFRRTSGSWSPGTTLHATDTSRYDHFGHSISLDNATLVVGAHGQAPSNLVGEGAVYVFEDASGTLTQTQKLKPAPLRIDDEFGFSVASHAGNMIVGAPQVDTLGNDSGDVRFFEASGSTWGEVALHQPTAGVEGKLFHGEIDVDADTVAVGAALDGTVIDSAGAAYVFERGAGDWSAYERLVGRDIDDGHFGSAIHIRPDELFVGEPAPYSPTGGRVHFFERQPSGWTSSQVISSQLTDPEGEFGASLDVSGQRMVVGSPAAETNKGAVEVFENSTQGWAQVTSLQASVRDNYDEFGLTVAIDGDVIVVGAPGDDTGGSSAGSAYVYEYSAGTWTQVAELSPTSSGAFGTSVAVLGDTIAIGAIIDANGSSSGGVYVYRQGTSNWALEQMITPADGQRYDVFGATVALEQDRLLVGAPRDDDRSNGHGAIYVFERSGTTWTLDTQVYSNSNIDSLNFGEKIATDGERVVTLAGEGRFNSLHRAFVVDVTDDPVAEAQTSNIDEDTTTSMTLTGVDPDGLALSYAIDSPPSHGTLSGTPPTVQYTPDPNYFGPDSFDFVVDNGTTTSAPATVTLNIAAVNDAPTATDQSETLDEDDDALIELTATDIESDPLSYTIESQPSNGSLTGTPPTVTYVPGADFHGNDSFVFLANDGDLDSAPATISLTVSPVNDPPVAQGTSVETTEDTAVDFSLTATDPDATDTFTFTVTDPPSHGTLSQSAPDLTYTPDADFNGQDSLVFEVSDGQATASATVSIEVTSVNDAPTFVDPTPDSTIEGVTGEALAFEVAVDDPDGPQLDLSLDSAPSLPSGATFDIDATSASFQWNAPQAGIYDLTLEADDSLDQTRRELTLVVVSADQDGDGVIDSEDLCPDLAGDADDGCPLQGDGGDDQDAGGDADAGGEDATTSDAGGDAGTTTPDGGGTDTSTDRPDQQGQANKGQTSEGCGCSAGNSPTPPLSSLFLLVLCGTALGTLRRIRS